MFNATVSHEGEYSLPFVLTFAVIVHAFLKSFHEIYPIVIVWKLKGRVERSLTLTVFHVLRVTELDYVTQLAREIQGEPVDHEMESPNVTPSFDECEGFEICLVSVAPCRGLVAAESVVLLASMMGRVRVSCREQGLKIWVHDAVFAWYSLPLEPRPVSLFSAQVRFSGSITTGPRGSIADTVTSGAHTFEAALVGDGDQASCQLWSVQIKVHVIRPAVAVAFLDAPRSNEYSVEISESSGPQLQKRWAASWLSSPLLMM